MNMNNKKEKVPELGWELKGSSTLERLPKQFPIKGTNQTLLRT
jgi:hypothetical protein